ncbi:protein ASPARTIC PROTEASE IN GUARD CELL 1-like [Capsicum chacoense]
MVYLFHFHLSMSIFVSILFVVGGNENLFSPLNSTYIHQAKEIFMSLDPSKLQDPLMSSYTFTIYHSGIFEKSKFKDYDSLLINMLDRSEVRASYLASIFEDDRDVKKGENTTLAREQGARGGKIRKKVPKTTSTHFEGGPYVASFLLGSNQVKNLVQIDTGSDLIWWQCGPCEENKCYKQGSPLYDSTKSKTFQKIDCVNSSRCFDDLDTTYTCNISNHECKYNIRFASGQVSNGFMADDVITFVSDHQPVQVTFGCGKDQTTGQSSFGGTGIAGLGRRLKFGSYSLPSQFGADLMSICLPGFYSGKTSSLNFHITPWRRTTSAKIIKDDRFLLFYFVNLYKIFIGDKLFPVHPSWWKFNLRGPQSGVTVDTGATITHFPTDLYIVFCYLFRREVGDIPLVEGPHKTLDTCYKDDPKGRPLYFPDVKLYFGEVNPKIMLLLSKERVMIHFTGYYCLAFMGWIDLTQ